MGNTNSNLIHFQRSHPYLYKQLQEKYNIINEAYMINERFGVFDYDEHYYRTKFANIILNALKPSNNLKKIKLFDDVLCYKETLTVDINKLAEYSHVKHKNHKKLLINVFVSFDTEFDVYSITNEQLLTDYNYSVRNSLYNQSGNTITMSIIMLFNKHHLKMSPDSLATLGVHELIHCINAAYNKKMADNMNNANGYAAFILNPENPSELPSCINIVNLYNNLKQNNWEITNISDLHLLVAASIYYCDKSERAAFLENFEYDCIFFKHKNIDLNYKTLIRPLLHPEIVINKLLIQYSEFYTIYFLLHQICNNIKIKVNYFIDDIIIQVFKYYNIKTHLSDIKSNNLLEEKTIENYIKVWNKAIQKWIYKANLIIKREIN